MTLSEAEQAVPGPDNQPVCPFCGTGREYAKGSLQCDGCGEEYMWVCYHGDGLFHSVVLVAKAHLVGKLKPVGPDAIAHAT